MALLPRNEGLVGVSSSCAAEGLSLQCTIRVRRGLYANMKCECTIEQIKQRQTPIITAMGNCKEMVVTVPRILGVISRICIAVKITATNTNTVPKKKRTLCEIGLEGAVDGEVGKTSPCKSMYNVQSIEAQLAIFVAVINMKVRCLNALSPARGKSLLPLCFFGYQIAFPRDCQVRQLG